MNKALKKVYLPSGLVASMYNLYGGGAEKEALNLYDIQLLCSYMEFYFNYTNPDSKKYIYRFYSLPHFYKANPTGRKDLQVESAENKIVDKYTTKVADEVSSERGALYTISKSLKDRKSKRVQSILRTGVAREIDPSLGQDEGFPCSPYILGNSQERERGGFRIDDLYKIRRRVARGGEWGRSADDYIDVPMFEDGKQKELSTFFILNPNIARPIANPVEYAKNEEEMRTFLAKFFASDSYKLLSEVKTEQYAPDVQTFIGCFRQAVAAYKKLGFKTMNKENLAQIEQARANNVNYGAVQE